MCTKNRPKSSCLRGRADERRVAKSHFTVKILIRAYAERVGAMAKPLACRVRVVLWLFPTGRLSKFESCGGYRETFLHFRIICGEVTDEAAVLEERPLGSLKQIDLEHP